MTTRHASTPCRPPSSCPARLSASADGTLPAHQRLSWSRAELDAWAKRQALASAEAGRALRDEVWNLEPQGRTPEEAFLRSADPRWWRRAGARCLRRDREAAAMRAGAVWHDGQRYVSDAAVTWQRESDRRARHFARTSVVHDPVTQRITPLEGRIGHPRQLAARYYAFLKGIETLATEAGLRWAMLTITLPPEWHARPQSRTRRASADGESRGAAPSWNGALPDAGHRELARGWHRLRAQLRKHHIILSGVRTEEPMQDGTPHWHCAFFFRDDAQLQRICHAVLTQFPAGLRIREVAGMRAGKLVFRVRQYDSLEDCHAARFHRNARRGAQCQLDIGAAPTEATAGRVASFASYVLKYVAKACGVSVRAMVKPEQSDAAVTDSEAAEQLLRDEDEAADSLIDSGPAARVRAHRSTWAIRGIEFYGIPKGAASCWDLLRQVRLDDEAERASLDAAIVELAEICQRDKGQGFADYLRLLGGLGVAPLPAKYAVKPVRTRVATQYCGEGERLVGVAVQDISSGRLASALVRPMGRQLLRTQAAQALVQAVEQGALMAEGVSPASAAGALVHIATVETCPGDAGTGRPAEKASSEQQRQAIELPVEGHHAVLAAAGSGKTHLLVERARYLLSNGVPSNRIVLTTFTREAAEHLRERLRERGVHGVRVGTMHALARQWLAVRASEPDFERWLRESAAQGKRDKWLLVDEAQDLSPEQWTWVQAHGRAVFAVGDERQAIYAWRGAKAGGLTDWAAQTAPIQGRLLDEGGSVALSVNRRCAAPIVALANALPLNMPATQALHEAGDVQLQRCASRDDELDAIVAWLEARRGDDAAVLARSNAEVAWLKSRLKLRGFDVPVMTIHAAKGREWEAVAVSLGLRKPSEAAAEANQTWYVALTRAKRALLLTSVGLMPPALEHAWARVATRPTAALSAGTSDPRGTADSPEGGQRQAEGCAGRRQATPPR